MHIATGPRKPGFLRRRVRTLFDGSHQQSYLKIVTAGVLSVQVPKMGRNPRLIGLPFPESIDVIVRATVCVCVRVRVCVCEWKGSGCVFMLTNACRGSRDVQLQ